ncbi:MAG TPA: hypothetical protein DCF33_02580 [Saprospirales bacterium]|nr:hypothetical protein [Saprospirales bacterium]
MKQYSVLALILILMACKSQKLPESPDAWKKIRLDFKQLDAEGLTGSSKGKVAQNYEFCIPAKASYWKQVKKLDATAQKNSGKGRVGCTPEQWLIIGSTHQKNYQRVLFQLANLPYIKTIEPTFWE